MDDMLKQADEMTTTINLMQRMYDIDATDGRDDSSAWSATRMKCRRSPENCGIILRISTTSGGRSAIISTGNRIASIFPSAGRLDGIFDGLDGVDQVTDKMEELVKDLDHLDTLMPQLLLQFPQMIATMQSTRTMMLTMHSTMSGIFDQMDGVQR